MVVVIFFLLNQLEINIYSILNISSIQNGYILISLATYGFCFTKTYIVNIEAMIIIQQWQKFGRKKGEVMQPYAMFCHHSLLYLSFIIHTALYSAPPPNTHLTYDTVWFSFERGNIRYRGKVRITNINKIK